MLCLRKKDSKSDNEQLKGANIMKIPKVFVLTRPEILGGKDAISSFPELYRLDNEWDNETSPVEIYKLYAGGNLSFVTVPPGSQVCVSMTTNDRAYAKTGKTKKTSCKLTAAIEHLLPIFGKDLLNNVRSVIVRYHDQTIDNLRTIVFIPIEGEFFSSGALTVQ